MVERAQFPPAGSKCTDCGCCPANVYAGNDPVCFACDAGEPCAHKKSVAQQASLRAAEAAAPVARVEKAHTRIGRAGIQAARALKGKRIMKTNSASPAHSADLPDLRSRFDRDEAEIPVAGTVGDAGVTLTHLPPAPEGVCACAVDPAPLPAPPARPHEYHLLNLRLRDDDLDRLIAGFTTDEKVVALQAVLQSRVLNF